MKPGDTLTLNATIRAVHAEWAEVDLTDDGSVAPIRLPLSLLEPKAPTTAKGKRTPDHDKA